MIALSWSRWSDYDQCPRKFSLKYIAKAKNFQEDPKNKSAHLQRGENLHKQLENYVLYKRDPQNFELPNFSPECEAAVPLIDRLFETSQVVLPEMQMAVDSTWKQVEWFAKNAYYRAIIDLIAGRQDHAIVWDWKSGKFQEYADECGQLHLTGAMVIQQKGYSYVDVSYVFIDHRRPSSVRITQDEVPKIISIFDERHARVNSETQWLPKRNDNCRWCNATRSQCPFGTKSDVL
jgi:CRISPR/Cas system-associated exonuclease Cas4 (RecB family)